MAADKSAQQQQSSAELGAGCVKSTMYNMIVQVMLRVTTFLLNAFILNRVDREILGLINIRLTLLGDTIIFLSREAFRLACQGHNASGSLPGWSPVLNLIWLSVPVSIVTSVIMSYIWIHCLALPSQGLSDQYVESVVVVCISVVVQMFAEAPCLVATVYQFVRLRVVVEFILMSGKLAVLVYAVVAAPDNVVRIWAYGSLISSLVYTVMFYVAFLAIFRYRNNSTLCQHKKTDKKFATSDSTSSLSDQNSKNVDNFAFKSISELMPSRTNGAFQIDQQYKQVAISFLGQGVMKQVLTEGEKYLMTFLDILTLAQQGTYDVISNLGSLACRFVFRPVEENCYLFFSQQWVRGKTWEQQDQTNRLNVHLALFRLLRLTFLIGLVIVVFGFSYSHLVLTLYGGVRLADDGGMTLLRGQCLLVACLAVNGMTECFARTVMTDKQINRFNLHLIYLSIFYLGISWALTQIFGPVGLILANCVNICIRIFISVNIINSVFKQSNMVNPLTGLLPDNDILFILLCTGTCVQLSEMYFYFLYPWIHFMIGAILFFIVVISIILKEDFILAFLVHMFHRFVGPHDDKEKTE